MSYTPDILIQKESFLKAFQDKFNGSMPDEFDIEQTIKDNVRKNIIRKKEFRGLKKLKERRDKIKRDAWIIIDNTDELTETEKEIIAKSRLAEIKEYLELIDQIQKLEKKIWQSIEYSPDYITWKELKSIVECDSTVTIEGKEYYWVITELSSVAHALCDWLEENDVTYVPSYGR